MDAENILDPYGLLEKGPTWDRATIHYILEMVQEFLEAEEWCGPNADCLPENIPLIEKLYSRVREFRERPLM